MIERAAREHGDGHGPSYLQKAAEATVRAIPSRQRPQIGDRAVRRRLLFSAASPLVLMSNPPAPSYATQYAAWSRRWGVVRRSRTEREWSVLIECSRHGWHTRTIITKVGEDPVVDPICLQCNVAAPVAARVASLTMC